MSRRRLNAQISEKVRRKLNAFLAGEAGNVGTPGPRNVVALLPLVDGLSVDDIAGQLREIAGNNCSVAEVFDNLGVVHDPEIVGRYDRHVKGNKPHDQSNRPAHNSGMAEETPLPRDPYAIMCGQRLRRARIALGYGVLRRFAELTGEHENNLSAYEKGKRFVPPSYVQKLKELFGVSHDWVYGNDASCMRQDLSVEILNTVLDDE